MIPELSGVLLTDRGRWSDAIRHYRAARECGLAFDPAEIGFEFSIAEIEARERQIQRETSIRTGSYYEYKKKGGFNFPEKAA